MQILKIINPANISEKDAKKLKPRNVAVLPVSNHGYYKLPGGGIEEGEDKLLAFRRECLEEIGFDVEVTAELGMIIEYRTEFSVIQTSYCCVGKVIGEKKEVALTEHEMSQGIKEARWVPLEEAFKLVSTSQPNNYEGNFIKERDTLVLETARKLI